MTLKLLFRLNNLAKSSKHKSALKEQKGVSQSEISNTSSIKNIKQKRKTQPAVDALVDEILKGDITALSRAITLVESKNSSHLEKANAIIKSCLQIGRASCRERV